VDVVRESKIGWGGRMGTVKIFYKDDCPKCPLAKQLRDKLKEKNVNVLDYNVGTADGLAEASFYSVMSLPTVVVEDALENGVGEWRGDVPRMEEVLTAVHST
jgi:thiol-disulfide isomerase/thioredoxin